MKSCCFNQWIAQRRDKRPTDCIFKPAVCFSIRWKLGTLLGSASSYEATIQDRKKRVAIISLVHYIVATKNEVRS
jgi:hypothetical protein